MQNLEELKCVELDCLQAADTKAGHSLFRSPKTMLPS
jgi:hypothetical protein